MIIFALVSGLLGLGASLALRRDTDRARNLRETGGIVDERFALLSLPGFSLMLLGVGVLGLVVPGIDGFLGTFWGYLLAFLAAAIALFGLYMSILGLGKRPIPLFLQPAWMKK